MHNYKKTKKIMSIITFILFLIAAIIVAIESFWIDVPKFVEVIAGILSIIGFVCFMYTQFISHLSK